MTATVALLLRSGGVAALRRLVIWLIRGTIVLTLRPCQSSHVRRTMHAGAYALTLVLLRAFLLLRIWRCYGVTDFQTDGP